MGALQENNVIAVLDIASATITDIFRLGYKDYALDVPCVFFSENHLFMMLDRSFLT